MKAKGVRICLMCLVLDCSTDKKNITYFQTMVYFYNRKLKAKKEQNVVGLYVTLRNENRPSVKENLALKKRRFPDVRSI